MARPTTSWLKRGTAMAGMLRWASAVALSMLVCNCGGSDGDGGKGSRADGGGDASTMADASEQRADSGADLDATVATHSHHDADIPAVDAGEDAGARTDAGSTHD